MDQKDELRRHYAIDKACFEADLAILNGFDGSREEIDYLTAKVAEKLMQRALLPFMRALLRKDLLQLEAPPASASTSSPLDSGDHKKGIKHYNMDNWRLPDKIPTERI